MSEPVEPGKYGQRGKKKADSVEGTSGENRFKSMINETAIPPEVAAAYEQANALVQQAYELMQSLGQTKPMPVGGVRWIHISNVQANDYNPNAVASTEMKLLHISISEDGYTQPVVAIHDPEAGKYIIVDGFHRYTTMRRYQDIYDSTHGYLPVVVIDKPIADRIASTVRHNRARGKHSTQGMASLVFQMLAAGDSDETITNKLGMEAEEIARLKHITGYSKLYKDIEYSTTVLTKTQAEARAAYARANPGETIPEGI